MRDRWLDDDVTGDSVLVGWLTGAVSAAGRQACHYGLGVSSEPRAGADVPPLELQRMTDLPWRGEREERRNKEEEGERSKATFWLRMKTT